MDDLKKISLEKKIVISVALCCYNGDEFIEQQLVSIFNQTKQVDEIIISDDGSSDGTADKINDLINQKKIKTPVVRFIQGERLGITKNFERAIRACSGDIIFLCDQDDIWLPEKVLSILTAFRETPNALLAFSNAHIVDKHANKFGSTQFQMVRMTEQLIEELQGQHAFRCLLQRNVVTGATVAFRKPLLDIALPFVDGWLHDEWLAILAAASSPLTVVRESLVLYRQHENNQCGMVPTSVVDKITEAKVQLLQSVGEKRIAHLVARLEPFSGGIKDEILHHAQKSLEFEQKRKQFSQIRSKRLFQICKLILKNQYNLYVDGWRSAVKDIVAK